MTTLVVHHQVADFDVWQTEFDGHEPARRSHGATGHQVLRDGNDVLILIEFGDDAGAHAFTTDPSLADVMSKAGVVNSPDISFRTRASEERY